MVTLPITTAAQAGLTGTVALTATSGSLTATGRINITTGIVNGPITLTPVSATNPGASISRGACLTISAGDAAAYECGDLRLVHSLPATTTMNKTRAPTLIYTSAHVHPITLVAADVTLDGTACPATVTLTVRFSANDATAQDVPWTGDCNGQPATRRLVIPINEQAQSHTTGLYNYSLEARITGTGGHNQRDRPERRSRRRRSIFGFGECVRCRLVARRARTAHDRAEPPRPVPLDRRRRRHARVHAAAATPSIYTVQPALDRVDTLEKVSATDIGGICRMERTSSSTECFGTSRPSTRSATSHNSCMTLASRRSSTRSCCRCRTRPMPTCAERTCSAIRADSWRPSRLLRRQERRASRPSRNGAELAIADWGACRAL